MKEYCTLANGISLLRLPLAIGVILTFQSPLRFVFLGAGALSDWLDGLAARKLGRVSQVGAFLDPLCDKLFVLTIFLFAHFTNAFPLWYGATFFLRDIVTAMGSLTLLGIRRTDRAPIQSFRSGKLVTFLQFLILFLIVAHLWNTLPPALIVLLFASLYSIFDYCTAFLRKPASGNANKISLP